MSSILAVPGIANTSGSFRRALANMAARHGWDVDSLAAVISSESARTFAADAGRNRWSPSNTATGLIQFIEATARGLGVQPSSVAPDARLASLGRGQAWATWTLMRMSPEGQLPLVEKFYERAFKGAVPKRPVDYYLPLLGKGWGLSDGTVLFSQGDGIYEQNASLDRDFDGLITVADMARVVAGPMSTQARVEVPKGGGGFTLVAAILVGLGAWYYMKDDA